MAGVEMVILERATAVRYKSKLACNYQQSSSPKQDQLRVSWGLETGVIARHQSNRKHKAAIAFSYCTSEHIIVTGY